MITFARSYHANFNYDFNCAEAINFATPSWVLHYREQLSFFQWSLRYGTVWPCSTELSIQLPEVFVCKHVFKGLQILCINGNDTIYVASP